ncbi:LuxR C-terminal-related transcriptional regulator [Nonomuraea typhae]|uniref:LuxR C-terminal-related transcriptional regulator n=1 Tax=Nonomuraea typhae TaxID=2603600 RepID=A0ABW7YQ72_9ACTN
MWPFVGREREIRAVEAIHDRPDTLGVTLAGAAGVGRTRLAREAVDRLTTATRRVEWVSASRTARWVPFGAIAHLIPPGATASGSLALLRSVVEDFAAPGRAVIGVDDAHLLDEGSATVLAHLAHRGRVFLVTTVTVGLHAPDAVVALWKDGHVPRLRVPALPAGAMDALLEHELGPHLDGISRHRLRRAARGNPLALRELLAFGRQSGALRQRAGFWRWEGTDQPNVRLAEIMAGALDETSPATRAVLETVACGEPLPFGLLEKVSPRPAIEEAERHGLLSVETHGGRVLACLAPPLSAAAVKATLPASRARAVYGDLAVAHASGPLRRADDMLRLGLWGLRAGQAADPDLLLAAARQAIARFDLGLAEHLVNAARALRADPAADRLLAEVLEFRGDSAGAAGVLPYAPPAGDAAERTAWALTSAEISYWGLAGNAEHAERTLDGVAHGQDLAEATRSWILLFDGRCEEALAVAERVLAAPGAEPQARIWAAASGAAAAGLLGRAVRAAGIHRDGRAVVEAAGDRFPWGAAQVGYGGCLALLALGTPLPAGRMAEDGYRTAVRAQAPSMAGIWAALRGLAAKAEGRVAAARAALHEAVVLMEGEDIYRLRQPWMAELAAATALAGAAEPAQRWLTLAEGCERGGNRLFEPWLELSRAWTHAASGALSHAARCAVNAASLAEERGQPAYAAFALYDAARLGTPGTVHRRLADLAERVEGDLVPAMALAAKGLATGNGPMLEEALPVFADLGHNLPAAEIASAAASAHRADGRWTRAGLLVERAAALAARCEGARTPLLAPRRLHSMLTPREREVALMAATLSSREIAERLGLSPRTVDNYLQRAYGKLGISGRKELRAGLER